MPKRTEANRKTNIGVARAVPLFLLAIIGYASWVLTKLICIDYLISPPPSLLARPRKGAATAVLFVRRPGLIPRGPHWYTERARQQNGEAARGERPNTSRSRSRSGGEKRKSSDLSDPKVPKEIRLLANGTLPFRVEDFWLRDYFVCNPGGRPPFCSSCYNYKPDRSHHCSELDRCVLKFDHFCPWVGGVVSETSFKFFIQFNFYGALYTLHVLVVAAYFFAERHRDTNFFNAHWVVLIAIAALFFLFSGGMCMSSCQFALINSTTVENLNRKTKVWNLAVYTSPEVLQEAQEKSIPLQLISYPRPPEEQVQMLQEHGASHVPNADAAPSRALAPPAGHRTFAILETSPGANPFDLGPLGNFQDIMGETIWDWLAPIHPSPCLKHEDPTSLYKLGPTVEREKADSGIKAWTSPSSRRARRRS